jgi:hypothetical protein
MGFPERPKFATATFAAALSRGGTRRIFSRMFCVGLAAAHIHFINDNTR